MTRAVTVLLAACAVGCSDPGSPTEPFDAGVFADAVAEAGPTPIDASVPDASVHDAASADAALAVDGSVPVEADAPLPDAWVPPPPPDAPSGPFADAAAPCEPESVAALCARIGAECGDVGTVDLCGAARSVACGTCTGGAICGGGATPNRCASCIAETSAAFCARLGKNCGSVTAADNCAAPRTATCGTCAANEQCSSSNVCACVPESAAALCARLGANCGLLAATDNCGTSRSVACGVCSGSLTCGGGGAPNVCGEALVCAPPPSTPTFPTTSGIPGVAPFSAQSCTAAQIGAFVDACLSATGTAASCEAWRVTHATCRSCLLTPESAALYGPFVTRASMVDPTTNPLGFFDETVSLGVQACLDHFRAGCGAKFFDFDNCLSASCDQSAGCVGADSPARASCRTAARSSSCATTADATFDPVSGMCRGVLSAAGTPLPGDACVPSAAEDAAGESGQRAFLVRLATAFCGP